MNEMYNFRDKYLKEYHVKNMKYINTQRRKIALYSYPDEKKTSSLKNP